jgi:hypothetical protein
MKRFGIGILWFIGFWLIGVLEGGIVLGMVLHAAGLTPRSEANHAMAHAVGQRFALPMFLVPLIAAIAGTVTGFLPGTGKRPPADAGQAPGPPPP